MQQKWKVSAGNTKRLLRCRDANPVQDKDLAGPKDPQSSNDAQSPGDPSAIVGSRQMANMGIDLPGGLPYQPWLVPIVNERTDNLAKDDPHIRCLPDNFLRAYGMPGSGSV